MKFGGNNKIGRKIAGVEEVRHASDYDDIINQKVGGLICIRTSKNIQNYY